ncbi:MAG: hypothetical protein ACO3TH_13580, partial [Lutimaribacter sp.]
EYFSPTVPIARISGGGEGSLGGDSVFSENTLPKMGTGASSVYPTESRMARGGQAADEAEMTQLMQALTGGGGGQPDYAAPADPYRGADHPRRAAY